MTETQRIKKRMRRQRRKQRKKEVAISLALLSLALLSVHITKEWAAGVIPGLVGLCCLFDT